MRAHRACRAVLIVAATAAIVAGPAAQSQWQYTAFGDSIATGYLAQEGYVPRYSAYVQADTGVPVLLVNLGQNGWSSGNLLNALQTNTTFQTAASGASVITWDIGLNDFRNARNAYKRGGCSGKDNQNCLRSMLSTFESNWDGVLSEILSRRSVANTIIRIVDIYDPWVATDLASNTTADSKETGPARGNDFQVLEYYLDAMNGHIALTAANASIPVASVHAAFNGSSGQEDPVAKGYITTDGIHPTDAGHEVLAQLLRGTGYAPLR